MSRIPPLVRLVLVFLCLALTPDKLDAAEDKATDVRRILIVYENESTLNAVTEVNRGLLQGLGDWAPTRVEVYTEYLDATRFPGPAHRRRSALSMAAKYHDIEMDVVLAGGPGALEFMLEHRSKIAPHAPLIFGGVSDASLELAALPDDAWGVISRFDLVQTVDLASLLHPDAKRLVVISGSSEFDRQWEKQAREELPRRHDALSIQYLSALTLEGFKSAASRLSRDTIVLILSVFEDAAGRTYVPRDVAAEIAAVSTAPSYAVYSSFVGVGVVGGFVETFEGIGKDMANLATQIMSGAPPHQQTIGSTAQPVVDWRQLRRWGIPENRLPAGTRIEFRELTIWQRYRLEILGALAIIALQTATIAGLVVLDRRRKTIKDELTLERLELAHLSRTAQLGQLSGAFAHELNQPLTAILANAEAGVRLLDREPLDVHELRDILRDIASDDRRAAGVIGQLRQLMLKGEVQLEEMDLNKAVIATIELAKSELVARQTAVDFHRQERELMVSGNLPQLQQIVLNLMLNASDAMADLPVAQRRITIETRIVDGGVRELSVSDRGPGISQEMREKAFKPFVSGSANSMGLGLSICRSIALAHGGALGFGENREAGARVVLTLPPV